MPIILWLNNDVMQESLFQQRLPMDEPYEPRYTKSDKIALRLESIERDRWSFENLILNPEYKAWFQERAIVRRIHSSTSIEGNRLNEDEAARLIQGENIDAEEGQKREILNLKKAFDFINEIGPNHNIPIDEAVIRQIHRLILTDAPSTLTPGEYRKGQNRVRNPMSGTIAYTPPNAGDVPSLMHQFALWLRKKHDEADAALVAGIAHLRLVEIHPFWDGNGRTARALEAIILERYGYSFNRLLSPERQFAWALKEYFETIGAAVGSRYQDDRDVTQWLEYFLLTLSVEISTVANWLVDFRRFMESFIRDLRPLKLTKRQTDLLAYLFINQSMRIREYERIFGKTSETARRDLKPLVGIGAVKQVGETRSRRYVFQPDETFWRLLDSNSSGSNDLKNS